MSIHRIIVFYITDRETLHYPMSDRRLLWKEVGEEGECVSVKRMKKNCYIKVQRACAFVT